jgi:thiol-disulfide isomerase/thioredoxin
MRWLFALVGTLAALAGTASWLATRAAPITRAPVVVPAALMAATFKDVDGRPRSLAELQGRIVVLNFWATWCAPCREEMPGFERLQARWKNTAQFVGISAEDPSRVIAFSRSLRVTYPLWTGGDNVAELSKRLGNSDGVLPHTVVIDASGRLIETRVGAYPEVELEALLRQTSAKQPSN